MPDQKVIINCKGNKLSFSSLRVHLKRGRDQVVWTCNGGKLTIQFKDKPNPFPGMATAVDDGLDLLSGTSDSSGLFPYSAIIQPSDGSLQITVDPTVDIDDVGPPKHRRKATKSAKKKVVKKAARKKAAKKKTAQRKTAKKGARRRGPSRAKR